ncbi:MAG: VOC family protein, partial [Chloroflexota bacterium]
PEHRWHRHLSTGGGLIDHALASDNLTQEITDAGERGVPYSGPHPGARTTPDGTELEWSTAHEAAGAGHALPFLIEDITDRSLRVPGGRDPEHSNGVFGIQSLLIAVRDLENTAALYSGVLGSDPMQGDQATTTEQDTEAVVFQAGRHTIELHQPVGEGPMQDQLNSRGDGPYAAVFHGTSAHQFDLEKTGGARLSAIVR